MSLKLVGDHLANRAAGETNDLHRDLFARSAFNRYYYAVFLGVRDLLQQFDSSWARAAHADVPVILTGAMVLLLRRRADRAVKSGAIGKSDRARLISEARAAAASLADLMNQARKIRTTADYEPERAVVVSSAGIQLEDCTLARAREWGRRAGLFSAKLRTVGSYVSA